MSEQLESISPNCNQPNIAGITVLTYLPLQWILTFPEFINSNNTITNAITIIPGKNFLTLAAVVETTNFKERQRSGPQRPLYNQTLIGDVAKDIPVNSNQFNIMPDYRFIIVYTYPDGQQKLLGSPEYPFKFEANLDSGRKPGTFSGHKFKFVSQNPFKAPFYAP